MDEDLKKKIRHEACEKASKLIQGIKKKYKIDELPLAQQIKALNQIQEGFFDATQEEEPSTIESPE